MFNSAPIGVFDSGVGGLTVVRRLTERLPYEKIVYLGDTARVPYGTKSEDTVIRYARSCASLLLKYDIKLLVVACNTASAYALESLRDELDIPVLGVVHPGARTAVQKTANQRIGVIGTAGTIQSGAYQHIIRSLAPEVQVFAKSCPLFVPLAEEGWTDGEVPRLVAEEYLTEFIEHGVDTLVLGCTHYPLLAPTIAEVLGDEVALVDSAEAVSLAAADTLTAMAITASATAKPKHQFLATDAPSGVARVAKRFFGHEINDVEWVNV